MNQTLDATAYEISIPTAALSAVTKGRCLEIQTAKAKVVLPGGMLSGEQAAHGAAVMLRISAADSGAMSAEIAAARRRKTSG